MSKRNSPETDEQINLFTFLRSQSAKHPVLLLPFAINNGFYATAYEKDKQKQAGLQNGVWDIFLPPTQNVFDKGKAGGWVEMKIKPNDLTKWQRAFRNAHFNSGESLYRWYICYSWIEAAHAIVDFYGIRDANIDAALGVYRPNQSGEGSARKLAGAG